MHREEFDRLEVCAQCGRGFIPENESGFRFGTNGALCWTCAIQRGGTHDPEVDAWTHAPDLQGLADEAYGPRVRLPR